MVDFGFVSTASGQGVHFFGGYIIPSDEYPAPLAASIVNYGGGTHEGVLSGTNLYIVNHGMNCISRFGADMKKSADLTVGDYPHDITVLGSDLWVVCQDGTSLQAFLSQLSTLQTPM